MVTNFPASLAFMSMMPWVTFIGIKTKTGSEQIPAYSIACLLINNYSTSACWIWDGTKPMRGLAPIWLYSSHIQHLSEWKNNIISFIVLFKTPTKYQEFFPTSFVKTTDFQLVFNFEQSHAVTIYGEHGIMAHIPWWLSQSEL